MRIKAFDIVIALAAAGLVALSAVSAYSPGSRSSELVIKGRDGEWVYPLSSDRVVSVAGPLGDTLVAIEGKTARIKDSPCPNKTCVAGGSISRPGQWLACLPNQVLVRIEGGADDADIDAAAY